MITDKKFYNVGGDAILSKIAAFFSSIFKRTILLSEITHITYSELSNEFVIHVPKQYDYRLRSHMRDEVIKFILFLKGKSEKEGGDKVKMWVVPIVELTKYTKTDNMKKSKFPTFTPIVNYLTHQRKSILKASVTSVMNANDRYMNLLKTLKPLCPKMGKN